MIIQMAGIRNVADAKMCAELGVDIIGLLVGRTHTSDDFITKEMAKEIRNSLPLKTQTTLITHLENAEEIIYLAKFINVDNIQLHSYIKESEVKKIVEALPNKKLFRLIHIDSNGTLLNDIEKIKYVDFYFTDSINKKTNQVGGTGLVHNFEADKKLIETLNKPVIIAGGLTPDNVKQIIVLCNPYGVDVNSGCRGKNGMRDKKKVLKFVANSKLSNKKSKSNT